MIFFFWAAQARPKTLFTLGVAECHPDRPVRTGPVSRHRDSHILCFWGRVSAAQKHLYLDGSNWLTGILYINPVAGTESPRNGDFLMSEAQGTARLGTRVKLAVLNDSASSYLSGVVLGKQVIGSKGPLPMRRATLETALAATITLSRGVQHGDLTRITCPGRRRHGQVPGDRSQWGGAAASDRRLGVLRRPGSPFTITTGGTNYAVADEFTITVGTAAFANGGSDTANRHLLGNRRRAGRGRRDVHVHGDLRRPVFTGRGPVRQHAACANRGHPVQRGRPAVHHFGRRHGICGRATRSPSPPTPANDELLPGERLGLRRHAERDGDPAAGAVRGRGHRLERGRGISRLRGEGRPALLALPPSPTTNSGTGLTSSNPTASSCEVTWSNDNPKLLQTPLPT